MHMNCLNRYFLLLTCTIFVGATAVVNGQQSTTKDLESGVRSDVEKRKRDLMIDEIIEIRKQIGGVTGVNFGNNASHETMVRDELKRLAQSKLGQSEPNTHGANSFGTMAPVNRNQVKTTNPYLYNNFNANSRPTSRLESPNNFHSGSAKFNLDPNLVTSLQNAAITMEIKATELERNRKFTDADNLRDQARQIRNVYRQLLK